MLLSSILLLPGELTPPAPAEGVFLSEPSLVWAGGSLPRVWVHGVLRRPVADLDEVDEKARAALPRGVFVASVTEAGQLATITSLVGDRELLVDPVIGVPAPAGPALQLAFSVDVGATFALPRDACHLHASAGRFTSVVRRAEPPRPGGQPAPADRSSRTPMTALLDAHGFCRTGEYASATEAFSAALVDPRIEADLTGAHLYNAACAASLAAAAATGAAARSALEEQALRWLRDDVARVEPLLSSVLSDRREGRAARLLERRRESLVRRREMARTLDPDLQHLRGCPGWAPVARAMR